MNKFTKIILFIVIPVVIAGLIASYFIFFNKSEETVTNVDFLNANEKWADSLLAKMSLDEKIGQIIMIKSDNKDFLNDSLSYFIENYHIGATIVEKNKIDDYINFVNYFLAMSYNFS